MPPTEESPPVTTPTGWENSIKSLNDLPGTDEAPPPPEKPPEPAAPAAAPAPVPEPKAPEPAAPPEPDDDLPRAKKKEPEAPKKPAAPPVEDEDEKRSPKELRAIYKTTKAERDTLKGEIEKLKGEQATLREQNKKAAAAEVQAEIEELRKQVADYDVKVRYLKYEESGEFKEKYQEPLKKAWENARRDLDGFKYTDANGQEKEATVHDIAALMGMNATNAAITAKQVFGEAASEVLAHRRELIRLTEASENARQEYRQKGSQRAAEEARNAENAQKQAREYFDNHLGLLRKERAEFFGDDPNDPDGNGFIRKGDALVKKALLGEGIPEGITPQERAEIRIKAQAEVAARASAFGRERHRVLKLQEENETLKQKIKAFEKSEPDTAAPTAKQSDVRKSPWEKARESLDQLPGV